MVIYLALAASLVTLGMVIRIVRFALGFVRVAAVAAALGGHIPSVGQLSHLL